MNRGQDKFSRTGKGALAKPLNREEKIIVRPNITVRLFEAIHDRHRELFFLTGKGMLGAKQGLRAQDPTIAELLKPLGFKTAQIGKNHLGDRNEYLPTAHGFDYFYGNLYHLNAEEEPEDPQKTYEFYNPTATQQSSKRGAFLCHDNWCSGYRNARRMRRSPDSGMQHVGFRLVRGVD